MSRPPDCCQCCRRRWFEEREAAYREEHDKDPNPPAVIKRLWAHILRHHGRPSTWDGSRIVAEAPVYIPSGVPHPPYQPETSRDRYHFTYRLQTGPRLTVEYVECEGLRVWERIVTR